ncbi:MAG: tetratricopeptide repeat protein [Acidobacteriota bacterium]
MDSTEQSFAGDAFQPGLLCQACGALGNEGEEVCSRCQSKLLVLSGPPFEEDLAFEAEADDAPSFDEHLLERISVLEEMVKGGAESLRRVLALLRQQERSVLVNNTGLSSLYEWMVEQGHAVEGWSESWEERMSDRLAAVEDRDRFTAARDRVLALFSGRSSGEFTRWLEDADLALGAYDRQAALECFEAALRLDPENYELALLLAESYFEQGDAEVASKHFQRVLEVRPDHYDGLVYAGALRYEQGDAQRAIELLSRAARLYPDAFLPHFSLGAVCASLGELRRAIAHLERAVTLEPMPQALYLLGSCLYETGGVGRAIRHLQEAVRLDPAFDDAYRLLGLAYLQRRWRRKALEALSQAEHLAPRTARLRELALYITDRFRGELHDPENEKVPEEANLQVLETLLEAARSALLDDELLTARSIFLEASSLVPEAAAPLVAYALTCLELNQGRETEQVVRRALDLEPEETLRSTAYAALIEALRSQGRLRECERIGRHLLAEGASEFTRSLAYCELARSLAEMEDDLDQALDYAQRSVELSPEELKQVPLAALGWIHYKRNELDQAVDFLSRSAELVPAASTLQHLGMVLLASGEQERAQRVLARARRMDQETPGQRRVIVESVHGELRNLSAGRMPKD